MKADGIISIKYTKRCCKEERNNTAGAGRSRPGPRCRSDGMHHQDGACSLLEKLHVSAGLMQYSAQTRAGHRLTSAKPLRSPVLGVSHSFASITHQRG